MDQDGSTRRRAPKRAPTSPRGRAHHPILRHRRTGARARAEPRAKSPEHLEPSDETDPPSPRAPPQALRDLAAADVLAAPAVDAATGDYVGWITCGSLLRQILRALYPRLLAPELLAQDDLEAFLYRSDDPADPSPDAPTVLAAMISEAETQFTSAGSSPR